MAASSKEPRYLVGRYHEIALKGRNQWRFVEQLKKNLRALFADYALGRIRSEGPRLIVELPDEIAESVAIERAAAIFGLQNFSLSRPVELDIAAIERAAVEAAQAAASSSVTSFRISARRADKRFALTSMEIERRAGAAVKDALGLKVDLEEPALTITIEILPDVAHVSAGKHRGAGGLPVGATGRGVAMLSGGIDSPVAAYRMMQRGLSLDYIHFHSHPLVSAASKEKARELVTHLTRHQARTTLTLVPFADIQREILARTLRPLRVVLYRRFMVRIAGELARRLGARALVTGESLGQVASQTLENITVIEKASAYPVMRPLIGMDKNEIVEQARRIGTFETSILPDQDCCSLFVPAHPETHAELAEVEAAEARFAVDTLCEQALDRSETVRVAFPPKCAP